MTPPTFARPARIFILFAALLAPLLVSAPAAATSGLGPCAATQAGSTITLTANCTTSSTITAPDGVTVDGDGFTITAVDPVGDFFSGPVLKSTTGTPTVPASMNVKNLTVAASLAANAGTTSLSGLYYENAGGTITNVLLSGITSESLVSAGRGLEVRNAAATTAPNLSINGLRVRNYGKSGIFLHGKTTFDATNVDIGPATGVDGTQWVTGASNSFTTFGGANGGPSGTLTNSKIAGNRYAADDNAHEDPNVPQSLASAMLIIDSPNVVVSNVTVTGVDSDNALIAQDFDGTTTTHVTITCSTLTRTSGGNADPIYGQAVTNDADDGSVTVTAGSNTFSGWVLNYEGAITPTVDPACTPATDATVQIKAKRTRVVPGQKIRIRGTASPALAGVTVSLQIKNHDGFDTIATTTLPADGRFRFVNEAKKAARHNQRFRVVVGTGALYAGGTSNVVKVRVVW